MAFFTCSMSAQQVSRAYCGNDGKAHITFPGKSEQLIRTRKGHVGCEHLIVADDGKTIAWSALVKNCCTSYPIPTSVIVYRNQKQSIISPGQMIWDWHFIDKGDRLAILSGPVHGEPATAALYNANNARVLARWEGKGTAPTWASAWQTTFLEKR